MTSFLQFGAPSWPWLIPSFWSSLGSDQVETLIPKSLCPCPQCRECWAVVSHSISDLAQLYFYSSNTPQTLPHYWADAPQQAKCQELPHFDFSLAPSPTHWDPGHMPWAPRPSVSFTSGKTLLSLQGPLSPERSKVSLDHCDSGDRDIRTWESREEGLPA
jgi:hypothetical protein